jgi:hypothetical protein
MLMGLVLMSFGSYVAWKSHETGLGISGSRLLAGVGGMIAMYGLMCVLGSGALAILMVLGGASFFSWSLWAVSSGGSDIEAAKFGLWCGPLLAIIGLVFVSPFGRSKASDTSS